MRAGLRKSCRVEISRSRLIMVLIQTFALNGGTSPPILGIRPESPTARSGHCLGRRSRQARKKAGRQTSRFGWGTPPCFCKFKAPTWRSAPKKYQGLPQSMTWPSGLKSMTSPPDAISGNPPLSFLRNFLIPKVVVKSTKQPHKRNPRGKIGRLLSCAEHIASLTADLAKCQPGREQNGDHLADGDRERSPTSDQQNDRPEP